VQIVHKLDESIATDALNKKMHHKYCKKNSPTVLEKKTEGTRKMSSTIKRSDTNYENTK